MKVFISSDEAYPVYEICPKRGPGREQFQCGVACEVPDHTVARWKRVIEEYEQVQDEMDNAQKAAFAEQPQ